MDAVGVLYQKLNTQLPPPTQFYPNIPPRVVKALMPTLATERHRRTGSVAQLKGELERIGARPAAQIAGPQTRPPVQAAVPSPATTPAPPRPFLVQPEPVAPPLAAEPTGARRRLWPAFLGVILLLGGGLFAYDLLVVRANKPYLVQGEAPLLYLSRAGEVYLGGKKVQSLIQAKKELEDARKRWQASGEHDEFSGEVVVCADGSVRYEDLREALAEVDDAGFGKIEVGRFEAAGEEKVFRADVTKKECPSVPLGKPPEYDKNSPEAMVKLAVLVQPSGYILTAGGERMVIGKRGGKYDRLLLGKTLGKIKERLPQKMDIQIAGPPSIPHAAIYDVVSLSSQKGFTHITLAGEGKVKSGAHRPDSRGTATPDAAPAKKPKKRRARVVAGRAEVRGALDKEIIRRIIRRHINEVKYCYKKALQSKPNLRGRVIIQFTISPTGQVVMSVVQKSTLRNRKVETCIAMAVRRWLFPKPKGGGIVIVSYPFVLRAVWR